MSKICVVGSINFDMVTTTDRIPKMGETINGLGFATFSGGKGANQAVAAARLGADVTMIGCVGQDSFGKVLIEQLAGDGINIGCVKALPAVSTGVATIIVCGGDNFIILEKGANARIIPKTIDEYADILLSSDMVIIQNEIPIETNKYIIKKLGGRVKIMYNPAPSMKLDADMLSGVDILVVNEHECGDILNCAIKNKADAKSGALKLHKAGIQTVIVTMGSDGAVYNDGDDSFEIDSIKVKVKDTTAAGDSFCGAIALAVSSGKSIHEAIRYATCVSALTVTKEGAQASLPFKDEVNVFMEQNL